MKVVFLDVDGVLNGYGQTQVLIWKLFDNLGLGKWYKQHRRNPFGVHEEKVRRLSKIIKKTNAKVVMSSCWRGAYWDRVHNGSNSGYYDDIDKLSSLLNKYSVEVIDITPKLWRDRQDEIDFWLYNNKDLNIESFVILDDENSDLTKYVGKNLVQTSEVPIGCMITGDGCENTGLKRKHVKQAIDILNIPIIPKEMKEYMIKQGKELYLNKSIDNEFEV